MLRRNTLRVEGQSVIEVIVAVAIFIIIAGSAVVTILGSLSASRLAEEETRATLLAVEGMEAVQSIRNQSWDNIATDGNYYLRSTGGTWEFFGTSDLDSSGRFSRTVTISQVERDANGDIVEFGGEVDDDTKKITIVVDWDFTPARSNSVQLVSYASNWQEAFYEDVGATPTITPTGALTSTPTPTSAAVSCSEYCVGLGYSTGTCRKNARTCGDNGETHESGGDTYCTGGPNADTCCCAP